MGPAEPPQPGEDLPLTLRAALAGRTRDVIDLPGHRAAAVLVPLFRRDREWRLLFTERGRGLRAHGGQVSFPGGAVEREETPERTALREADEEVGVDPERVRVLGRLGDVPTPTGFVITPVVGWIDPAPAAYRISPVEVAEAFEVAVARFRAPGALERLGEVERFGRRFPLIRYRVDGHDIWGATARMVQELLSIW
ncbi:MAG TPA: CoA pyrophosphatase [Haliangiales bacterium]|nr:CoA pyrophosphatase [Haliangiales bacterium]